MSLSGGGSCEVKILPSLRTLVIFERMNNHIGSETTAKIFIQESPAVGNIGQWSKDWTSYLEEFVFCY